MNLVNMVDQMKDSSNLEELGIVVKCYTEIGKISQLGKVSIQAQELINLDMRNSSHTIALNLETSDDYPRTSITSIEYKDLDKTCAAIDKIKLIDPKSTKFKNIEVMFVVGELTIMVFNMPARDTFVAAPDKIMFSLSTGGCSCFFDIAKINELKSLIVKAKETIHACRYNPT